MKTLGISSEWGEILDYFFFLDYKKDDALLKKAQSCLYLSMTSDFFFYMNLQIGAVFHIEIFYQTNLVADNIFVEPTEHLFENVSTSII